MKIATKALKAILVATTLSLHKFSPDVARKKIIASVKQTHRAQQYHDRKMLLRAAVLDVSPKTLKRELKTKTFRQVMKARGFSNNWSYLMALQGKVRDELQQRGFSPEKLNQLVIKKRAQRL